jgi:hypothetical protein
MPKARRGGGRPISEIPKTDTKNNLNIPQLQEYSTWPTFSSKVTYEKEGKRKWNQKEHLKSLCHWEGNKNQKEGKTQKGGLKATKLSTCKAK